jgi:hypothetical protein
MMTVGGSIVFKRGVRGTALLHPMALFPYLRSYALDDDDDSGCYSVMVK